MKYDWFSIYKTLILQIFNKDYDIGFGIVSRFNATSFENIHIHKTKGFQVMD